MTLARLAATYRLLAIEGCDGTGKSTIAAALHTRHGYRVIHSPRTPDHIDLAVRYRRILDEPGRLVLDRCFVSELVYGPLQHHRSRLSFADAIDLSRTLATAGGVLLHLTGGPTAIRQRLTDRGDTDLPSPADLQGLIASYQHVFDVLRPHAPVIDIDIHDLPE